MSNVPKTEGSNLRICYFSKTLNCIFGYINYVNCIKVDLAAVPNTNRW